MKAVLCKAYGPPESLVIEEQPSPQPGPGQVRVGVHVCGVNFPDTLIIADKYQFKPPRPFSPGSEVAGVVEAIGEGVTKFKVGDRVLGTTGNNGGMAGASSFIGDDCRCSFHYWIPIRICQIGNDDFSVLQ